MATMCSYLMLIFFISIFFAHLSPGHGLKCWICTTEQNSDCENPNVNNVKYEQCISIVGGTKFVCRTIKYFAPKENRIHTSRACVDEKDGSGNEPCSRVRLLFYSKVQNCTTCDTDFCRSEISEAAGKSFVPAGKPLVPADKSFVPKNYAAPTIMNNHNDKPSAAFSIYQTSSAYVLFGLLNFFLRKMIHLRFSVHIFISLLGLIIFLSSSGEAIRCWDCNSNTDPQCADPFDNRTVFMKDCEYSVPLSEYPNVKATMCRKIRQKVNGKWRYFRDCAYLGEPGIGGDERYCLMRTGTHNIFVEICTCASRHGCNTASLELYSVVVLFSSILCAFYLK